MIIPSFKRGFLLLSLGLSAFFSRAAEPDGDFFREQVQPILENHCYECHSAKAEKVKGGLLLDTAEGLAKGGDTGAALSPGDPDNSKIVIAVRHADPDLKMPPKKRLSDEQIAILERWVKMGARDPRATTSPAYKPAKELWSTKPIHRTDPPSVKRSDWAKDPVDQFILAELEKRKLQPVSPSDKRALIRRATFDLTGLPPAPSDVEAFLKDDSNEAFARVVDSLLKSSQFGERWGRHWLDLARYADSNGLDQIILFDNAWRYRDYVIEAFNSDKSFPDFVREQIAGDLLPFTSNEERQQKWIATGFLVLGPKNFAENREKLLMDIADEQIDVTSRAFLGLTVSCARCHDHKFDPIPTRDYYALAGIFLSTQTLASEASRTPGPNLLSQRPLGNKEEADKVEEYQRKLAEIEAKRDRARSMARDLPGGIDSKELDGIVVDNLDAELVGDWKLSNYSTNFVDKNYLHDGNEKGGKGKKSVRFSPKIPEDGLYEIRLAYTARLNRATNVPIRVQGSMGTKTVFLNQTVEPKFDKAFETLGVFQLSSGTNSVVEVLTEGTKGFVVVDAVQFLPQEIQLASKLTRKRSLDSAQGSMMMMSEVTAARREEYENAVAELMSQAPPPLPMALAVREGEVRNSRIQIRGDPARPGEEVPRGFLSLIEHVQTGALGTDSSGRLALANWIANEQNPLTARVMVNRIWLHLFGRGLVNTPDNFGSMGEAPSHPELLDLLASDFISSGWSTKKMIRRLMLTSTYQLSSAADAKASQIDPENRYYWRMNRKRLDAESLRDAILAVNQSLELRLGGEPLAGDTTPGRLPQDDLLTSGRRTLYLPVFRGSVNDLFQVFDFPDPHGLAGKRFVTTAPTQALFLMNSPFVLSESGTWAEKLVAQTGLSDAELVEQAYQRAYARPCSNDERTRAVEFLKNFTNGLIANEPDPVKRRKRAVQAFCQAIIESTEFRFLN